MNPISVLVAGLALFAAITIAVNVAAAGAPGAAFLAVIGAIGFILAVGAPAVFGW